MRTLQHLLLVVCGLGCLETTIPAKAYAQRRIYYNNRPNIQLTTKQYQITVTVANDAKVRLRTPPPRFDQKGNPLKYTTEELKQLKGDTPADQKLPGYKSDFGDLKAGDVVSLSLARMQANPKDPEKPVQVPAGTLAGVIAKVDGGAKQVTVNISTTEVKIPNLPQNGNQNKITLDAKQFVVAGILVLVENPIEAQPVTAGKKK